MSLGHRSVPIRRSASSGPGEYAPHRRGRLTSSGWLSRRQAGQQELVYLGTWIDKLKLELARLRRMQFGHSSEKLSARIEQLELIVEEFEASAGQQTPTPVRARVAIKPVRKPLPAHLPRESVIHAPADACPDCGTTMHRIGEDLSEMLEYVPARFKVIRQVRPKLGCACCHRIVQEPAPNRPIDRGLPAWACWRMWR